jgi:hypothetical protein
MSDSVNEGWRYAVSPAEPMDAAMAAKRSAALLRDARSVLRRLDVLSATAQATGDPSLPHIAEARAAVERLVSTLAHQEVTAKRQVRDAVRRSSHPAR